MSIQTQPLAPTAEAIDGWLAQQSPDFYIECRGERYMADVKTRSGSWRYVLSAVTFPGGERHYHTIRAEGNSNSGRETYVPASKITQARGYRVTLT
jgi:hypothetical protein